MYISKPNLVLLQSTAIFIFILYQSGLTGVRISGMQVRMRGKNDTQQKTWREAVLSTGSQGHVYLLK